MSSQVLFIPMGPGWYASILNPVSFAVEQRFSNVRGGVVRGGSSSEVDLKVATDDDDDIILLIIAMDD